VKEPANQSNLRIIGIDCATVAQKVGLALCLVDDGRPRIDQLLVGKSWPAIDAKVAQWAMQPTLLAVDAPLGWPAPMADSLQHHQAGAELSYPSNTLFRRNTDDVVAAHLGKRPLDVGADRIARTAHTALSLLARLRETTGEPIPLAWHPGFVESTAAIEVYPAGTLAARNLPHSGYKTSTDDSSALRQQLVEAIQQQVSVDQDAAALMAQSDHALDAVLCTVAGLDFLSADVLRPNDLDLAKREGWIWVTKTRARCPPE
jgi:predicted RNase H-like nuclease